MTARILDGREIGQRRREALAGRVRELTRRGCQPMLVAVGVGDDPGWRVYQSSQQKACRAAGIAYRHDILPADCSQDDLVAHLDVLNADPAVHGIILQSPLPDPLRLFAAQARLSPAKDVEAVGPANLGLVVAERHTVAPCTALAAVELARAALPDLKGIEAVVVGASVIVGKPIAQLLIAGGATVANCHIFTRDLASHTRRAELLVVAAGKPGLITPGMVREGAVVIDVGINRVIGPDGRPRVVGDVDPAVAEVAGALTPVPGGVGALTTTILLEATVAAAQAQAGGASSPADPAAAADFIARLGRQVLVFDGGIGTALIARGIKPDAVARANLGRPAEVLAVHRGFVEIGVDALTANTFGVCRRSAGGASAAAALVSAGVRLARQAAPPGTYVFGSVGPLAIGTPTADAEAEAADLGRAMVEAGADGFIVETQCSTAEAAALVRGLVRTTGRPVMAGLSLTRADATELAAFAQAMTEAGAVAVGVNCGHGPRRTRELVACLAAATDLPVYAMPNAGYPRHEGNRPVYDLDPSYFADVVEEYLAAGAAVVGGCCGVAPEHLAPVVARCRGRAVIRPGRPGPVASSRPVPGPAPVPYLCDLAAGRFPVAVLVPGRLDDATLRGTLRAVAGAGAAAGGLFAAWSRTDGQRLPARLRYLADAAGLPAMLELSADAVTPAEARHLLLSAHLLGIRLVLVDGGGFTGLLPHPGTGTAAGVTELVELIARLNSGDDPTGGRLAENCAFACGVRLDAARIGLAPALARAGAAWLVLAPVYDRRQFRRMVADFPADLPLVADILVMPDHATAAEFHHEVAAIEIPPRLLDRLKSDPRADLTAVLAFLDRWRGRLAGANLILPDRRGEIAIEILRHLGTLDQTDRKTETT